MSSTVEIHARGQDAGRAKALEEVRKLVVGSQTGNPYQVLNEIAQLCGGSSPSEWAEHLAKIEAAPKRWTQHAMLRAPGYRGVRPGDSVPCSLCDGKGWVLMFAARDRDSAGVAVVCRPVTCTACAGDGFEVIG
jgi:hypothetical protein